MVGSRGTGLRGAVRVAWRKVMHLNDTPHGIALGFAAGAFLGVFPTFGVGGVLAVGVCALFKLNYIAAVAGAMIVMNPFTTPFFWLVSAWTGCRIFGRDFDVVRPLLSPETALRTLGDLAVLYLVGNLVVSTVTAGISYIVVKRIVTGLRRARR